VGGIGARPSEAVDEWSACGLLCARAGLGGSAFVAFSPMINVAAAASGGVVGAASVHREAPAE